MIRPRPFAIATLGWVGVCLSSCGAGGPIASADRTTAIVQGSNGFAAQYYAPRDIVAWAGVTIQNPTNNPAQITKARVVAHEGVLLKGIRVKRGPMSFAIGKQHVVDRGAPAWRWARLLSLPIAIGGHQRFTIVVRLQLTPGALSGRAIGIEATLVEGRDKTLIRVPRVALVCPMACPKATEDRAWDALHSMRAGWK